MKDHRSIRWRGRIRKPVTVQVSKDKVVPTNTFGKVDAERLYVRVHGHQDQRISVRRLPGDRSGMTWPRFRGKVQRHGDDVTLVGTLRETKFTAFSWILWGVLTLAMLAITTEMVRGRTDAPWFAALVFAGFAIVFAVLAWCSLSTRYEDFDTFGGEVEDRLRAWANDQSVEEFTIQRDVAEYLNEDISDKEDGR